jgi:CubicO group peptidase (beta-lactamase class C family)
METMTMHLTLFLCALLLLPAAALADRVDDVVRAQIAERHVPGASIAVVRNGRLVKAAGYGMANLEVGAKARKDSVYEIGSITKQFTATLVMMLVEEGRVSLDGSIRKYLPDAPGDWSDVTVRHLLTHTSGIRTYTELDGFQVRDKLSPKQFIERLAAHPLDFPPGTKQKYNNSGYNLLGFIIESVTGKGYWDVLRERILTPLGMKATRARDLPDVIPNRVSGYVWEKDRWVNRDGDLTDIYSAGAMVSTALDLAKWDAALRKGKVLKPESLERMWTPHILPDGTNTHYGFGWGIAEEEGRTVVSHGGSTSGFSAHIRRERDSGLTVIVLTNSEEMDVARDIAKAVVAAVG